MSYLAIKVENVSKDFKLPHEKTQSVKGAFLGLFKNKNRTIETQHALRNVSFEIKKGEFFGIVGRNGSGKSTLLKMLAGIYQPTKGSVEVNGKLVPFIELGVGFNPELTGRENVYLNGALLGFSKKEVEERYQKIVDFAELGEFMDQKLKNYSSGMQVRLAFAVAIIAEADILLVDEVLAVGDADFQRKCFNYFEKLKKGEKTVVFVSHDMEAVRKFCDRAILIEDSKLVAIGDPNTIATDYTRLFTEEDDNAAEGQQRTGKRWGDKKMVIDSVRVTPKKAGDKTETIRIEVKSTAKEEMENPVFGVMIKNAAGERILGTNTNIKKKKLGMLKAGERLTLVWTVPNVFSDGEHFVDIAAQHSDGITTCDWWEEAASFGVLKAERTPYVISPSIEVEV